MLDQYDPIAEAVVDCIEIAIGEQPSLYSPNAERQIVDEYQPARAVILLDEPDAERCAIRLSALAARVGY